MSRCGMEARSATTMRPLMSLPREIVSLDLLRKKLLRFDALAQPDGLALAVGDLNADGGLAGHALDEDAFGAQGETEVVAQAGDAAVLDAGLGLELEGGDHGAGVDLRHRAVHFELGTLGGEHGGQGLELIFVDRPLLVGTVQQGAGRQLEPAGNARQGGLCLLVAVGARGDFGDERDVAGGEGHGRHGSGKRRRRGGCEFSFDAGLNRLFRRAPGLHQLRADHRLLLGAALLQLLLSLRLGARGPPILEAIAQGEGESEARLQPQAERPEGEGGREIEGDSDGAGANQIGADQVEEVNEDIGGDASEQALDGDGVQPAPVPGEQSQEGGGKDEQRAGAEDARYRRFDLARAKPAPAEQAEKHRHQESGDPGKLQRQVAAVSADDADPVARRARRQRRGGGVERRVERRIGRDSEEKEERGDEQQEADKLVQPAIVRRSKDLRENLHVAYREVRQPEQGDYGRFLGNWG